MAAMSLPVLRAKYRKCKLIIGILMATFTKKRVQELNVIERIAIRILIFLIYQQIFLLFQ